MSLKMNYLSTHLPVEALAIRIQHLKEESEGVPVLLPIEGSDGTIQKYVPASYGQEQMVARWKMSPAMYNMPTTIVFHGTVDIESMKKAFLHLTQQQSSLRSVVRVDSVTNNLYQRVLGVD